MKGETSKKPSTKLSSSLTKARQRKLSDMLLADSFEGKEEIHKKVKKQSNEENAFVVQNKLSALISEPKIIDKLAKRNITELFPIQQSTFSTISTGQDLLGRDRTGSGKTLAYVLPLCQQLYTTSSQILILLPTRELVTQVSNDFSYFLPETKSLARLYGGVDYTSQISQLKQRNNAVIIGTPGRTIDLFEHKQLIFTRITTVVIDEADHMLDMGFQEDVEKILSLVKEQRKEEKVQFLLWSATLPYWIHQIAGKFMDPKRQCIDLVKSMGAQGSLSVSTVRHLALNCPLSERIQTIGSVLLCYGGPCCYCIIFTETKQDANDVMLQSNIKQDCQVLHGDIPQKQRELTFKAFREGKFKCLIATNVAARGLDIPQVDLIVQLDPPKDLDTYIHRAGRTARAGKSGTCITFYRKSQLYVLNRIAKHARIAFTQIGTPQPTEIIAQGVGQLINQLKEIKPTQMVPFESHAKKMIEELGGSEQAIQRVLCNMIGTEGMVQRSLLCAFAGYITFIAVKKTAKQMGEMVENKGMVWRFLREKLGEEIVSRVKGVRVFKDKAGAAFDIKEEDLEIVSERIAESNEKKFPVPKFFIERAQELPELEDPDEAYVSAQTNNNFARGRFQRNGIQQSSNNYNNNNFNNNNNNFNKSRSFGGNKGGRNSELEIFVGNIEKSLQEDDVKQFLKDNNVAVSRVNLLHDETGNSKGACFVTCRDIESLNEALQLNGYALSKRKLRINMANDRP